MYVENVHTLCAGKPESDDRGNNISVKSLGTSLDRCIERYIKKTDYYYYNNAANFVIFVIMSIC